MSEVTICNLALGHLGDTATVASIKPPDASVQAQLCARFYPMARNALLEMASWGFATRRVKLAEVALPAEVGTWLHAYAAPNAMVNALAVLPNVPLDNDPNTLYNNSVPVCNGTYSTTDYNKTHPSWTFGVNYELADNMSVYFRANKGAHFGDFDNALRGNTTGNTPPLQKVQNFEAGYKYQSDKLYADISVYHRQFNGLTYQPTDGAGAPVGPQSLYGLGSNPYPYTRGINFNISYPIFNRFQRENQIQTAQIALTNAEATLRDSRLAAQQTIVTQIGLLRNAEEQVKVQENSVRANEEALRVNQQRYTLGAGTFLDVLTSQSSLVSARQGLIQARLNYRNAKAQIEATTAQVNAAEIALNGVREEARVGQRTTLDVLNAQQELVNARVALVTAQHDRVVASYTLLAAVGGLSMQHLGLNVLIYDPQVHYQQVRDAWVGVRTPDGK